MGGQIYFFLFSSGGFLHWIGRLVRFVRRDILFQKSFPFPIFSLCSEVEMNCVLSIVLGCRKEQRGCDHLSRPWQLV